MARIVFDLDGTLIDSAPDIHAVVAHVLRQEGVTPPDLPTITSFIGNGLPHLVKLTMEATGLSLDHHGALTVRVLARYESAGVALTRPYPGVTDALAVLAAQGHRLAICTNKPEAPARAILGQLGLDGFETVVGGDSLGARKPDPAPLHAALEVLGEGPAIYVGDSEVDAETARRAGVPFLLFTEGYRKSPVTALPHRAAFDHFDALPGLIGGLGAQVA